MYVYIHTYIQAVAGDGHPKAPPDAHETKRSPDQQHGRDAWESPHEEQVHHWFIYRLSCHVYLWIVLLLHSCVIFSITCSMLITPIPPQHLYMYTHNTQASEGETARGARGEVWAAPHMQRRGQKGTVVHDYAFNHLLISPFIHSFIHVLLLEDVLTQKDPFLFHLILPHCTTPHTCMHHIQLQDGRERLTQQVERASNDMRDVEQRHRDLDAIRTRHLSDIKKCESQMHDRYSPSLYLSSWWYF